MISYNGSDAPNGVTGLVVCGSEMDAHSVRGPETRWVWVSVCHHLFSLPGEAGASPSQWHERKG